MAWSAYTLALFLTAGIAMSFIWMICQRDMPLTWSLLACGLALGIWSSGSALALLATHGSAKLFWAFLAYSASVIVPVAWLCIAHALSHAPWFRKQFRWGMWVVIPTISILNALFQVITGTWWRFTTTTPFTPIVWALWLWPWVQTTYSAMLFFLSAFLLATHQHLTRSRSTLVFTIALLPLAGNTLHLQGISTLDVTPILLVISFVLILASIAPLSLARNLMYGIHAIARFSIWMVQHPPLASFFMDSAPRSTRKQLAGLLAFERGYSEEQPKLTPVIQAKHTDAAYHSREVAALLKLQQVAKILQQQPSTEQLLDSATTTIADAFQYDQVQIYLAVADFLLLTASNTSPAATKLPAIAPLTALHHGELIIAREPGPMAIYNPLSPSAHEIAITTLSEADQPSHAFLVVGMHGDRQIEPHDQLVLPLLADSIATALAQIGQIERLQAERAMLEHTRDKALAANEAKSTMLAQVGHEIRAPISGVVGAAELLATSRLDAAQRELVAMIQTSSSALLRLVNDLLDAAQLDAGRIEIYSAPFDLHKCIEDALSTVAVRAAQRQIKLGCTIAPNVPAEVIADAGRLRQILINLLANAVTYTDHGEVEVEVDAHDLGAGKIELCFDVRDTGIGIAPELFDQLFKLYTPLAKGKHGRGGNGLGLAISQRLSSLMGGRIWATSKPGAGSIFSFTILAETNEPQQLTPELTLLPYHILLVDNTPETTVAHQLHEWGLTVSLATTVDQAASYFDQGKLYDLVIIDLDDSDHTLAALIATLRSAHESHELPILVLSSLEQTCNTVVSQSTVLYKPLQQAHFQQTLQDLLCANSRQRFPHESNQRALVVDDDPVAQRLATLLLEQLHYCVVPVSAGEQALALLEQQTFAVALIDMRLPDTDGPALVRAICERWPQHIRPFLIAATASTAPLDRAEGIAAGIDMFLTKPLDITQLATTLGIACTILPAAATPSIPTAALDQATFERLVAQLDNTYHAQFNEFVQLYLDDTTRLIEALCCGKTERSPAFMAHRLKSSSALLGALPLAALCEELETASDSATQTTLIAAINTEFARVRAALLQLLHQHNHEDVTLSSH